MTAAAARQPSVLNALTIDVEEYFQVSGFADRVSPVSWDVRESRVVESTARILDILEEANAHATFFILGWVAERQPTLVREIAMAGHEVASHGFWHQLVYNLTPERFRVDLRRARVAIEDAAGIPVLGYRAPSFSITARSRWALDVLAEEGYAYDSSVFPIVRDRYGIPGAPREAHVVSCTSGALWELPPSTIRLAGMNVPVAGGGYLRLFPYSWTRAAIHHLNQHEHRAAVVYLHPWELDPDQPRIPCSPVNAFRHYVNLGSTEDRLCRLLSDFRFGTASEVLVEHASTVASSAVALSPLLAIRPTAAI